MGKLVVSEFVTLDGVFEDPGGAEAVNDTRPDGGALILTYVPADDGVA